MMLKVNNIDTFYGNVQALNHVSLEVNEREIVAVIGSNGAGKSTLMNSIMGIVPIKRGSIEFMGQDISKMKAHEVTRLASWRFPKDAKFFPA